MFIPVNVSKKNKKKKKESFSSGSKFKRLLFGHCQAEHFKLSMTSKDQNVWRWNFKAGNEIRCLILHRSSCSCLDQYLYYYKVLCSCVALWYLSVKTKLATVGVVHSPQQHFESLCSLTRAWGFSSIFPHKPPLRLLQRFYLHLSPLRRHQHIFPSYVVCKNFSC